MYSCAKWRGKKKQRSDGQRNHTGRSYKKRKKKKIEINTKLVGGHDRKRDRDRGMSCGLLTELLNTLIESGHWRWLCLKAGGFASKAFAKMSLLIVSTYSNASPGVPDFIMGQDRKKRN